MAENSPSSLPPPTEGEYAGHKLIVFTAVFLPFQVLAVGLRYYARWIAKAWGREDAIVVVSLGFQIIIAAFCIGAVNYGGVGYHVPYLEANSPEKLTMWGKYLVALSALYFGSVNIPKLAILALYHRVFPAPSTRLAVNILVGIVIALTLSNVIVDLSACRPFEANWDLTLPGAKCINKEAFFIWGSIPNIVTDVAMIVLPMPTIWKLQTSKNMKVGLTVTFAVGSFGMITSIIRFTTFFQNNSFVDGTFSAVDLLIWTQVETGVYLISACLPTYKPLFNFVKNSPMVSKITHRTVPNFTKAGNGYAKNFSGSQHRMGHSSTSEIPLQTRVEGPGWSDGWARMGESEAAMKSPGITITTNIHQVADQKDKKGDRDSC